MGKNNFEQYISHALEKIKPIVEEIHQRKPNLVVSDLIDDSGNQYVDIVMEGGGVHGIALLGYLTVLEEVGIRFRDIGGTSAGSITALLLSAIKADSTGKKCEYLLKKMLNKNFYDFVDGDSDARDFIDTMLNNPKKVKLAFKGAQIIDNLQDNFGLNPGNKFLKWISDILKENSINNFSDLDQKLNNLLNIKHRDKGDLDTISKKCNLIIIASDITTETKVKFPEMASLYWKEVDKIDPAIFVRASMSIPYFFEPYIVSNIPKTDDQVEQWKKYAAYTPNSKSDIPDTIFFVDGGMISNFPIAEFHVYDRVPNAPTFGVKLGLDNVIHKITGPIKLFLAIFNSARHALDFDFINKNPDYKQLVKKIDINEKDYNWLDFDMPTEKKIDLFILGAEAAKDFLLEFDWYAYRKLRKDMILIK